MKPRGMLMIEHRLIEKVLKVAEQLVQHPERLNPVLLDGIIDFIRVYADRTHHGKEEDILFRILAGKKLTPEQSVQMQELIRDHDQARAKVRQLIEHNEELKRNPVMNLDPILKILKWLTDFYPVHIRKEDDVFFPGTETCFTPDELKSLLADFYEFDRKMIHEKYQNFYQSIR